MLITQSNLATTYKYLGRLREALRLQRDVYSGCLRLYGEEHVETIHEAYNYANNLLDLARFKEAKTLMRRKIPVARSVLGKSHELTIKMQWNYAAALVRDAAATLDDLREAVTTLEDTAQIARRVLGGAHPATKVIEDYLKGSRIAPRPRSAVAGVIA